MSVILTSILAGIATDIGAPLIEKILSDKFGKAGGVLGGQIIRTIAKKANVEVEDLSDVPTAKLEPIIREVETEAPELIAEWNDAQEKALQLQLAEMDKGPLWTWVWRPAWMYLFGVLWVWALIILPLVNSIFKLEITPVDLAILLSVNGLYMALYMGGHTVKHFLKDSS